jgi:VRR-NUC domain
VTLAEYRRINEPSESKSQTELIRWWSAVHRHFGFSDPRVLLAFPLQGARTRENGSRLKAEGMRAGTFDLLLCAARGGKIGLWVEMKKARGTLSPEQKTMVPLMQAQGYQVSVCRSCAAARHVIEQYLIARPEPQPVSNLG